MAAAIRILVASCVLPITLALAQVSSTDSIDSNDIYGAASATPTSTLTDNDDRNSIGGLVGHYYLVFLALVACLAALAAIMVWRRKKRLAAMYGRGGALQQDVNAWDSTRPRRRYWQGRWHSTETSREEGLNEHGEAPPPYMPKGRDEQDGQTMNGPAVPLQALSREQAGLKPPDYVEANAYAGQDNGSASSPSGLGGPPVQARQQQ